MFVALAPEPAAGPPCGSESNSWWQAASANSGSTAARITNRRGRHQRRRGARSDRRLEDAERGPTFRKAPPLQRAPTLRKDMADLRGSRGAGWWTPLDRLTSQTIRDCAVAEGDRPLLPNLSLADDDPGGRRQLRQR